MWKDLDQEQKNKFKKYCDSKYGETIVFSETGEPLYFDEEFNMVNADIIIKLLFPIQKN